MDKKILPDKRFEKEAVSVDEKQDDMTEKKDQFDFDGDGVPDGAEKERQVSDVPLSIDEAKDAKNASVFGNSRGRYITPEEADRLAQTKQNRIPLSTDDAKNMKRRLPDVLVNGFADEQKEDSDEYNFD